LQGVPEFTITADNPHPSELTAAQWLSRESPANRYLSARNRRPASPNLFQAIAMHVTRWARRDAQREIDSIDDAYDRRQSGP
jgi:uncharacterized protein HemY